MTNDATPPGETPRVPQVRSVDPGSVHVLYEPRATRVVLTGEIDAEQKQLGDGVDRSECKSHTQILLGEQLLDDQTNSGL